MKFIAAFLCIIVLALSIVPCCAVDLCEKQSQKTELTTHHQSQEDKNDCCGSCSGFFACGNCSGFIISKTFTLSPRKTFDVPTTHLSFYIQPFMKEISLDIWQPPQLS